MKKTFAIEPAVFMRQLACMVPAGIAITRCFDILGDMQSEPRARAVLRQIKQQLLAGHPLHASLRVLPAWYDVFAARLLYLGEQTGKLDIILTTLADYYENKQILQRKIRHALFYPGLILSAALLLMLCLFIFVIPAFAALFHDSPVRLPWLTRTMFVAAALLNQHLMLAAVTFVALIIATFVLHQRGKLTSVLTRQIQRLPPLHECCLTLGWVRFTRHLSLAIQAGVPILDALQLTAGLCSHQDIASGIRQLRAAVSAGSALHTAMQALPVFPVLIQQMVKVGEESGRLDALLAKTAGLLEAELENRIARLTALLEPLIMSILGVLIGGLVIGIYLPLFNLGSAL